MKLVSVKIHTDIVVAVPDDYDMGDPNTIRTIANGVKQDLVNIFDSNMVTIREIAQMHHIPSEYIGCEPWIVPNEDLEEKVGDLTCKELMERQLNQE